MRAKKSAKGIQVGSRVAWQTPYTRLEGEVVEDRGHIGVNGRRLWRILTFATYPDPRLEIEVPEADLTLLADPGPASPRNGSHPADGLPAVGSRVRYRAPGGYRDGEVLHDYGTNGRGSLHLMVIQPLDGHGDEPFLWPAEELLAAE